MHQHSGMQALRPCRRELLALPPCWPSRLSPKLVTCTQLCKRPVCVARQAPCAPDRSFYGGSIVLRVDAFKADASWMRLQAVQTVHQLASISVQTSSEAVVRARLLRTGPPVDSALKDACETVSTVSHT